MQTILIGGAWPYANGPLHIGHLASLLPGDVLARYWRARGADVYYVSGSDCHGTPITQRAAAEGCPPAAISARYHQEFCSTFQKLGFSYDLYTQTTDAHHVQFVQDFHRTLYQGPYVQPRRVRQPVCPVCRQVRSDRQIVGFCPHCGAETRGDQCEACGAPLESDALRTPRCAACGAELTFAETEQLYLLMTRLETPLRTLLESHPHWRRNAVAFTRRYLEEGLRDRAITRDLDWGIDVPHPGYEDKKIYIWAENVLGYLSASAAMCEARGTPFEKVWGADADTRHYYVHGKDNIPFHTLILPALLLAHGGLHLPDDIVSSEYMTLEGRKISTSHNWAVWAGDLADAHDPDAVRYFFLANGPEKRDTDFSGREFAEQINTELVGAWGNLVHRTLAFIVRYLHSEVPQAPLAPELQEKVAAAYPRVGRLIENGCFKQALEEIFALVRFGNRYYDAQEPWRTRTATPEACKATLANCTWLIANLAVLLHPFLPFSGEKVRLWLGLKPDWKLQDVTRTTLPSDIKPLFRRITEKAGKEP